jgi:tetratricopeptide (TPR) repeat protein
MNSFIIQYADPLFGILTFVSLIFIVSFFSYWWAIYSKRKENFSLEEMLKKIYPSKAILQKNFPYPKEAKEPLLLLANAFEKSGEFKEAIEIYLWLIEDTKNLKEKNELVKRLGQLYFKAGFFEKSKQIFLEILKYNPREKEALKFLLIIYEKTKNYSNIFELIESFEELNFPELEINYLKALLIIKNNKDYKELEKIYFQSPKLVRIIFEYLFEKDSKFAWEILNPNDYYAVCDILWNLPFQRIDTKKIKNNTFLQELYSAKKYFSLSKKSSVFELDVLLNLRNNIADLKFEYLCPECKYLFPLPYERCPNCFNVSSAIAQMILTQKKENEESFSF